MVVVVKHDNLVDVKVAAADKRVIARVHNERSSDAVDVQSAPMSVPPVGTVLKVSSYREAVSVLYAGADRALRHSGRSVLPLRPVLKYPMPVERDGLREAVLDVNDDRVTVVDFNERAGVLAVHDEHRTVESIDRAGHLRDLEPVLPLLRRGVDVPVGREAELFGLVDNGRVRRRLVRVRRVSVVRFGRRRIVSGLGGGRIRFAVARGRLFGGAVGPPLGLELAVRSLDTASFALVIAPAALSPFGVDATVAVELLAALRVRLIRAVASPSERTAFVAGIADSAALTVLANGALGMNGVIAGSGEGETVPAQLEGASDESREAEKERMIATHRSAEEAQVDQGKRE